MPSFPFSWPSSSSELESLFSSSAARPGPTEQNFSAFYGPTDQELGVNKSTNKKFDSLFSSDDRPAGGFRQETMTEAPYGPPAPIDENSPFVGPNDEQLSVNRSVNRNFESLVSDGGSFRQEIMTEAPYGPPAPGAAVTAEDFDFDTPPGQFANAGRRVSDPASTYFDFDSPPGDVGPTNAGVAIPAFDPSGVPLKGQEELNLLTRSVGDLPFSPPAEASAAGASSPWGGYTKEWAKFDEMIGAPQRGELIKASPRDNTFGTGGFEKNPFEDRPPRTEQEKEQSYYDQNKQLDEIENELAGRNAEKAIDTRPFQGLSDPIKDSANYPIVMSMMDAVIHDKVAPGDYKSYFSGDRTGSSKSESGGTGAEFNKPIQFQFAPESIEVNDTMSWSKTNSMGREHPLHQFNSVDVQQVTFSTLLFAPHAKMKTAGDLLRFVKTLEILKKPVPSLGRPPSFSLRCGNMFIGGDEMKPGRFIVTSVMKSFKNFGTGYEEEIGFIGQQTVYRALERGDLKEALANYNLSSRTGGYAHMVEIKVTLESFDPSTVGSLLPDSEKEKRALNQSIHVVARAGEEWESVAKRVYGSPVYGEAIRRGFPKDLSPVSGKTYVLPNRDQLVFPTDGPESGPLTETPEVFQLLAQTSDLRLRPFYSGVVIG